MVYGGDFFVNMLSNVLRQPIRKILRPVAAVMGVGAGLAALDGDTAVRICAGRVCGAIQIEEFTPEGGTVRCVARGTGADREDHVRARPIERKFGLEHLGIRAGLRPLANIESRLHSQAQLPTTKPEAKRPQGLSFAVSHEKLSKHGISGRTLLARCWRSDTRSQYAR